MTDSELHLVVYVSIASRPFSGDELKALLAQSRERNREDGITGMLLYKDGCFIQAFEGGKDEVKKLHSRISRDPRHRSITILFEGATEQRQFSQWTMGFKELADADVQHQPGFSEMLKTMIKHGRCSVDTAFAIRLLRTFTENMTP